MLAEALRARGLSVTLTREPGGAPGAEVLRDLLLGGSVAWSAPAETLLHFAARAEHVERTIRPALRAGTWVVCDRFSDSTMAYQGYGQGADCGMIATLTGLVGLVPDLTLVLDVSAEVSAARLGARGGRPDAYEARGPEFHARVAAGFREIARDAPERCVLIDANSDETAVHAAVMRAVEPYTPSAVSPGAPSGRGPAGQRNSRADS